jgi:hypothetical protein
VGGHRGLKDSSSIGRSLRPVVVNYKVCDDEVGRLARLGAAPARRADWLTDVFRARIGSPESRGTTKFCSQFASYLQLA